MGATLHLGQQIYIRAFHISGPNAVKFYTSVMRVMLLTVWQFCENLSHCAYGRNWYYWDTVRYLEGEELGEVRRNRTGNLAWT